MPKKSHVRTRPSENVVGLESSDLFAKHGVKGRQSLAGCGVAPHKNKPNCVTPKETEYFFASKLESSFALLFGQRKRDVVRSRVLQDF